MTAKNIAGKKDNCKVGKNMFIGKKQRTLDYFGCQNARKIPHHTTAT
jgi:hypothetical protein